MNPPSPPAQTPVSQKQRDTGAVVTVAFVLWTLKAMGGSEKVVYDIARKLDKKLYPLVIVSFEDGPVRKMYEALGERCA